MEKFIMKRSLCLFLSAAVIALGIAAPARAQIAPATSSSLPGAVGTLDPETGEIIKGDPNAGMTIPGIITPPAPNAMPALTEASRVAVMYYRMTGQLAPFDAWAKSTDAYKAASDFDRTQVLEMKTAEMKDLYRLGTSADTVIVDAPARLGDYSFKNKGFIITSFSSDMYFPFSFAGEDFAVIVPDLSEAQWLPVAEEKSAMLLDTAAARHNRVLRAFLEIEPTFADKFKKINLQGRDYAVISGKVVSIRFFEQGRNEMIYEQSLKAVSQEQLDLDGLKLNNLKK